MNKVPVMDEEPFLQVRHVSKRFGEGCDYCLAVASWSATYAQSARRCMRFAM